MNQETTYLSSESAKEEWEKLFESQFPDLLDNYQARMCFREGWRHSEDYHAEIIRELKKRL